MSNIEEDIKVLTNIEKLIRIEFKHYLTDREMKAINNVLLEREQDKKRIQELEEERQIVGMPVRNKRSGKIGVILHKWESGSIAVLEKISPRVINTHENMSTLEVITDKVIQEQTIDNVEGGDKNVAKVEDDIKYVKEMLEIARVFFKAVKAETNYKDVDDVAFCNAVEHILAERKQDKKKIKELEEHQKKFYNGELYTAKQLKQIEENQNKYFINKQKVKDVLQKNRNELFSTTYVDDIQYKPYTMQIDRINKIEKELLEGE